MIAPASRWREYVGEEPLVAEQNQFAAGSASSIYVVLRLRVPPVPAWIY